MATTPRHGKPYVYVTWITGVLAGDRDCAWAPWFKAHFRADKRPDRTFDLAAWTAEHVAMVQARAAELVADGWRVTVEGANDFRLYGKTAILSGKPDIVAIRGAEVLVVDCKTGKQRHSDFWQVLVYMLALPRVREDVVGLRLSGEVCYRDQRITVTPEELNGDREARIFDVLRQCGSDDRPAHAPSRHECAFCDITDSDCPERFVDMTPEEPVAVAAEF